MGEAPEKAEEEHDHPLGFFLYAAAAVVLAVLPQTSLWDDQLGTSGRRSGAAARFFHAIGPDWVSILFGLLAAMMLLIGIHRLRANSKG